jgi:hypothetical protein
MYCITISVNILRLKNLISADAVVGELSLPLVLERSTGSMTCIMGSAKESNNFCVDAIDSTMRRRALRNSSAPWKD